MKTYWLITLAFNIAGAVISFSTYVSPQGTASNLVWLVLNIIGVYISYHMLEGIKNVDKK